MRMGRFSTKNPKTVPVVAMPEPFAAPGDLRKLERAIRPRTIARIVVAIQTSTTISDEYTPMTANGNGDGYGIAWARTSVSRGGAIKNRSAAIDSTREAVASVLAEEMKSLAIAMLSDLAVSNLWLSFTELCLRNLILPFSLGVVLR
jgi:hypothetical protein